MRVIVTGDRARSAPELAEQIVSRLLIRFGPGLVIVHGAATGIDRSFAEVCGELGVEQEAHPARCEELDHPEALIRYDKRNTPYNTNAGPIRNGETVKAGAEMCVAVHRNLGGSKGTLDYVRRATRAGIPTHLIESEEATPRRLSDADSRVADVPKKRRGHDQKGTRNSD